MSGAERQSSSEGLGAFEEAAQVASVSPGAIVDEQQELLVFTAGDDRFGVRLSDVDSVVPWRKPSRVPNAAPQLLGVVQEQGRIIAVLAHPGASVPEGQSIKASRIIVCKTGRGLLGLPATSTSHMGNVLVSTKLRSGDVADTRVGTLVYLEAGALLNLLTSE